MRQAKIVPIVVCLACPDCGQVYTSNGQQTLRKENAQAWEYMRERKAVCVCSHCHTAFVLPVCPFNREEG